MAESSEELVQEKEKTQKTVIEKLNKALGIESIDSMLDSISIDSPNEISTINSEINTLATAAVDSIDTQIVDFKNGKDISLPIMESNLAEINELISISKQIIMRVYDSITSTSFVDPELVNSAASLIKATQDSVMVYVDLYKERKRFYNTIALEMLKQRNKLELLHKQHEFKMIEIGRSSQSEAEVKNSVEYSQAEIIKTLKNLQMNGTI